MVRCNISGYVRHPPDRLRMSSVLVVGVSGLGAELCKNTVLAGVKSVTLLDHALLAPCNLASRFLGHTDGVNVRGIHAVVVMYV